MEEKRKDLFSPVSMSFWFIVVSALKGIIGWLAVGMVKSIWKWLRKGKNVQSVDQGVSEKKQEEKVEYPRGGRCHG